MCHPYFSILLQWVCKDRTLHWRSMQYVKAWLRRVQKHLAENWQMFPAHSSSSTVLLYLPTLMSMIMPCITTSGFIIVHPSSSSYIHAMVQWRFLTSNLFLISVYVRANIDFLTLPKGSIYKFPPIVNLPDYYPLFSSSIQPESLFTSQKY